MSKFLGFLLGIVVALAGPAAFGVLTADGGIELNAKEMALAYGIGALIFWAVVSYFSGAAALGAALTFGVMIYAVHWIPNRTTNFLNDVPGVTTGMIDGLKAYTLNGVVPILAVISLVYAIQLIVQSVRRRRRERAEAERRQQEQELAQAQQEAEVAAVYPPAPGPGYAPTGDSRFQNFGNTSYDDLFDEEPAPVQPRSQADEHTMQFSEADAQVQPEQTAVVGAVSNDGDETVQTEGDETVRREAADDETPQVMGDPDATQVVEADSDATQQVPAAQESETVEDDNDDEPPAATTSGASATPVAAAPQAETPQPPQAPKAETPEAQAPKAKAPSPETPAAEAPKPEAPKPQEPEAETQKPESPSTEPPKSPGQQAFVRPKEEVGQQYRERMDDPEDTGEFFVGQFRPAGA